MIQGPKLSLLTWNTDNTQAFTLVKQKMHGISTLAYPLTKGKFTLVTDASNFAIGAVLQQTIDDSHRPIGYYSHKLTPTQQRYSAFDRELLGIYMSLKHFEHLLEGREFLIHTDHKPLVHALTMNNPSPRQQTHISYIAQFNCIISHIKGNDNIVADCLSRPAINAITKSVLFTQQDLKDNPPDKHEIESFAPFVTYINNIPHNTSLSGTPRPILAHKFRHTAFKTIHELHQPGSRGTFELLHTRVVWPNMKADINNWCKQCLNCQQAKTHRHTIKPITHFPTGNRVQRDIPASSHSDRTASWPACD